MNFIHIPKTGGMSIARTLGIPEGIHRRASEFKGYKFAFVRHPVDRLRSGYTFDHAAWPTFAEFVAARGYRADYDLYRPMTHWLDAPVEFIGRYESLQQDFDAVCDLMGVERRTLPHVNRYSGPAIEIDADMTAQIRADYAEDFKRFNYA